MLTFIYKTDLKAYLYKIDNGESDLFNSNRFNLYLSTNGI